MNTKIIKKNPSGQGNWTYFGSLTFIRECISAHNRLRTLHGSQRLIRSNLLCRYADEWAKFLANNNIVEHREDAVYGENVFMIDGKDIDGTFPVKYWYDEMQFYDFNRPNASSKVGHFTQLVWKNSREIGVGVVKRGKATWVVVNYQPAGNVINGFQENVLPPIKMKVNKKAKTSRQV